VPGRSSYVEYFEPELLLESPPLRREALEEGDHLEESALALPGATKPACTGCTRTCRADRRNGEYLLGRCRAAELLGILRRHPSSFSVRADYRREPSKVAPTPG